MLMLLKAMCHLFSLECVQAACSCPLRSLPAVKLEESTDLGSCGGLLEVMIGALIRHVWTITYPDGLDKVAVSTQRTL